MKVSASNDIGNPATWLLGLVAIPAAVIFIVYIFLDVIQTLTNVATHCRGCG